MQEELKMLCYRKEFKRRIENDAGIEVEGVMEEMVMEDEKGDNNMRG